VLLQNKSRMHISHSAPLFRGAWGPPISPHRPVARPLSLRLARPGVLWAKAPTPPLRSPWFSPVAGLRGGGGGGRLPPHAEITDMP
jgi:hypothetical protein